MKNRISKYFKNNKETNSFFLACEFKPYASFWNVIEPFAYDVEPVFIYGSLGIMSYAPESYAIVEATEECQPLVGYVVTITNPDMISLLDRMKGFLGDNAFNTHVRKKITTYTDLNKEQEAWCYIVGSNVLSAYQTIETVEYGIFNDDPKQVELLEKII